ncbi:MAG: hypothetical protein AVDCRST_MAG32-1019 [uncultured Nocardioides sp.]|uniref:Uncharacterized protein n=1 Tax=uncultured Nocardioides sp. TaxID=198441 RepID=A0A6J4N3Y4_9ACTN|nr:MAG: hypothetical protein AVDCRST_MAG32-1019 [uncultured Nocardioides sp.]
MSAALVAVGARAHGTVIGRRVAVRISGPQPLSSQVRLSVGSSRLDP